MSAGPQTTRARTPTTAPTARAPEATASTPVRAETRPSAPGRRSPGERPDLEVATSRRQSRRPSTTRSAAAAGAVTGWLTAPSAVAAPADTAYGRAQRTQRRAAPSPQHTARRYISAGVVLYDTTCWLYAAGSSATASAHALVPRPKAGAIARQHT